MTHSKITGLDTLRFSSFFVIFLNHATPYFKIGFLAIDFFFTLSAFLLTFLALNEIKRTGKLNRRNFMTRRILRIWPLYYFVLLVSFFLLPELSDKFGWGVDLPENRAYYYLFISNFYAENHLSALKQLWSIAVEEQFYIIFILLSLLLKRHFRLLLLIPVAGFVGIIIYYRLWPAMNLYEHSLYHSLSFASGMLLAKLLHLKKETLLPISSILIAILITLAMTILLLQTNNFKIYYKIPFAVFAALIILAIYKISDRLNPKNIFLRVTEQLGKYTYGLYVYSGFVIGFFSILYPAKSLLELFLVELTATIIIAVISYHLFERKFLLLKEKFRQ